jgi:hypothetical protein
MKKKISFGIKLGLTLAQAKKLAALKTPEKIQDFINKIPTNFEPEGDTCLSAREVMRQNRAHCIEAAYVACCALWINGMPPLLMDLQAKGDHDHVVAVFKRKGLWGAISKSNHAWLRWRDPVYRSLRELAMSYFHEYVSGRTKTLWSYSVPFDLRRFDPADWISSKEPCWHIATLLDETRHYRLVPGKARRLRKRDKIEVRAGKLLDFKAPSRKKASQY